MNERFNNRYISSTINSLREYDKSKLMYDIKGFLLVDKGIELDKISEDAIQYLRRKEALDKVGDGQSDDLRYVKFWFSRQGSYLGFTETNQAPYMGSFDMGRYYLDRTSSKVEQIPYKEVREGDQLKIQLDFNNIKTDVIGIACFSADSLFIMHTNSRYSGDTCKKTRLIGPKVGLPYTWYIYHYPSQWSNIRRYTDTSRPSWAKWHSRYDFIDNADYAIVIDMTKVEVDKIRKIRAERMNNKAGAESFMSNRTIRDINQNKRYVKLQKRKNNRGLRGVINRSFKFFSESLDDNHFKNVLNSLVDDKYHVSDTTRRDAFGKRGPVYYIRIWDSLKNANRSVPLPVEDKQQFYDDMLQVYDRLNSEYKVVLDLLVGPSGNNTQPASVTKFDKVPEEWNIYSAWIIVSFK